MKKSTLNYKNRRTINSIQRIPHKRISNLTLFYPIASQDSLQGFWETYIKLVENALKAYDSNIHQKNLTVDHVGLQVKDEDEFELCHEKLIEISTLLCEENINNRMCNIYRFNKSLEASGIPLPRIEIFNPVPGQSERELRVGVEHIAFRVENYAYFVKEWARKGLPIAYEKKIEHSTFFKTPFINGLLIEFRSDFLGE